MTLKNSTLLIRHQTADHGKRESESSLVPYSNFLIPQDSWGSCRILRELYQLSSLRDRSHMQLKSSFLITQAFIAFVY